MKTGIIKRSLRIIFLLALTASLSGCMYWIRAYQVYLQMDEFDRHFSVVANDEFTLRFKDPILYSKDFVSLSKLYASQDDPTPEGRRWRYWFRKVDGNNNLIKPEVKFYSDLNFNKENRLIAWSFSSLFLAIAPPKFLEVSLRSIGDTKSTKKNNNSKPTRHCWKKFPMICPKNRPFWHNWENLLKSRMKENRKSIFTVFCWKLII